MSNGPFSVRPIDVPKRVARPEAADGQTNSWSLRGEYCVDVLKGDASLVRTLWEVERARLLEVAALYGAGTDLAQGQARVA